MNPEDSDLSQPLRIAVLGVGNIGSAFAFQLATVGRHEVIVIARPDSDRLRQLESAGGIVNNHGTRAGVGVADHLDEEITYDLVIVTLLAHQMDAVLPALQRGRAKAVVFMFNNFNSERLSATVGVERCSFGMPMVQAYLEKDGRLNAVIGAMGQQTKLGQQRWVDLFIAAGLPAVLEPRMELWLRCHVPLCIAFESVSVAGMRRGGGASWGEARVLARGLHESFRLIQGLGDPIYPAGKARLNRCPAWVVAALLWFMSRIKSFRELLATGEAECRALIDVLAAAAPISKSPINVARILAMKPAEQAKDS